MFFYKEISNAIFELNIGPVVHLIAGDGDPAQQLGDIGREPMGRR